MDCSREEIEGGAGEGGRREEMNLKTNFVGLLFSASAFPLINTYWTVFTFSLLMCFYMIKNYNFCPAMLMIELFIKHSRK